MVDTGLNLVAWGNKAAITLDACQLFSVGNVTLTDSSVWKYFFGGGVRGGKDMPCNFLPLWHDFVGIWKIAVDVLHLEGVSIADFVVCSAVVGTFNHDDITSWTPQVDGVALTGQLSPY